MMAESRKPFPSTTLAVVPRPAEIAQRFAARHDGRVVPGDVVDEKYRVEALLGEGGMGYVVRARHLQLDQLVALKFMHDAIITRDSKRRLLREARGVASLRSRHVARVLDVGTHRDGAPYIVMEYLAGKDLATLLDERGALSVTEACDYVLQACEALAEAHAQGIVHRDLKLGNLFLTQGFGGEHVLKVLDFGVSKVPDHDVDESDLTLPDGAPADQTLTRAGDVLGSPRFMAPEQIASARNADVQSDVWSLGIILFTLIAGRLPFDADSIGPLVQRIVHAPVPRLGEARRDLPPGLEQVVARCLERDRTRRVTDCLELARLLAPFVRQAVPSTERIALLGKAFARAALAPASVPPPPASVAPPASRSTSTLALALLAFAITCLAIALMVLTIGRS